jgi:hypothetical protein
LTQEYRVAKKEVAAEVMKMSRPPSCFGRMLVDQSDRQRTLSPLTIGLPAFTQPWIPDGMMKVSR